MTDYKNTPRISGAIMMGVMLLLALISICLMVTKNKCVAVLFGVIILVLSLVIIAIGSALYWAKNNGPYYVNQ